MPFFGGVLTQQGLVSSREKVKAVLEMPTSTDATWLQCFLGMVNYLSKFVHKLSDYTELLRTLTVNDNCIVFVRRTMKQNQVADE